MGLTTYSINELVEHTYIVISVDRRTVGSETAPSFCLQQAGRSVVNYFFPNNIRIANRTLHSHSGVDLIDRGNIHDSHSYVCTATRLEKMSIEGRFVDETSFIRSMKDVRDDSSETNLLIIGHVDDNPHRLDVVHTGSDVSQMSELLKDNQVMYVLAKLTTTYDLSTTVKFVCVHWIGTEVPFSKRGRYGVIYNSVASQLAPYHVELEADSTSDITEEKMLQKLEEAAGTISKVMEISDIEGRQERGFTQTQLQNTSGRIAGKSITTTKMAAVSSRGAPVTFSPDVSDAIADVRSDDSPTNWLLAGYEGGNPKSQILMVKSGVDGLAGLTELLKTDLVYYGLLRVSDEIDDIRTVKFVYITW
ncbi:uncharacterized protein LOC119741508 isoform X2 [Patiria miniata]|nr:uncharacterized protein LOC119741508 isoform X2 [Patiria miniata]